METLELHLSDEQLVKLDRHFELLLRWNRRINLTSINEPEEIVRRHFGESLFLAAALKTEKGGVADIGSGAGFPGFPLAVAVPTVQVTLVESVAKKAAFLKEVTRYTTNASVFHGRFENLEDRFDWAVARGVSMRGLARNICLKASKLALLTGVSEAGMLSSCQEFVWERRVELPWKCGTVLLFGVPRGT